MVVNIDKKVLDTLTLVFIFGFIIVEIILLMSSIAELIHNIYKCRKRRRERNNESVAVSIDSFAVEEDLQDE